MNSNELVARQTQMWLERHHVSDPLRLRMADIIPTVPREWFDRSPEQILRWVYTQALRKE